MTGGVIGRSRPGQRSARVEYRGLPAGAAGRTQPEAGYGAHDEMLVAAAHAAWTDALALGRNSGCRRHPRKRRGRHRPGVNDLASPGRARPIRARAMEPARSSIVVDARSPRQRPRVGAVQHEPRSQWWSAAIGDVQCRLRQSAHGLTPASSRVDIVAHGPPSGRYSRGEQRKTCGPGRRADGALPRQARATQIALTAPGRPDLRGISPGRGA